MNVRVQGKAASGLAFLRLWHALKTYPRLSTKLTKKQEAEAQSRDQAIADLLHLALDVRIWGGDPLMVTAYIH